MYIQGSKKLSIPPRAALACPAYIIFSFYTKDTRRACRGEEIDTETKTGDGGNRKKSP